MHSTVSPLVESLPTEKCPTRGHMHNLRIHRRVAGTRTWAEGTLFEVPGRPEAIIWQCDQSGSRFWQVGGGALQRVLRPHWGWTD